MDSKQTFSIDMVLRRCKYDNASGYIYARITVDSSHVELCTKELIKSSLWNSQTESVQGRSIEVKAINDHVDNIRFKLKEKYRELIDRNCPVTAQAIKEAYLGAQHLLKGRTLQDLITFHKEIEEPKLSPGTAKNYKATALYLQAFILHKFDKKDIYLSQMDYQFIVEFENFIRHHPIKAHDPCKGNGVAKHIERTKELVSLSKKLKWIKVDPFEDFSPFRKRTKRQRLHIDELAKIEKLELFNPSLQYVKDLFVFSCYTGLAYADIMNLNYDDLEAGENFVLLKIYRKKSEELAVVPLFESARQIIDKYRNTVSAKQRETIFPPISNQEINRCVKILVAAAGILKVVTFHTARHTFATTVALKSGVPIETVSLMLGHRKLSTTQIYAEVDEEKIQNDMKGIEETVNKRKLMSGA